MPAFTEAAFPAFYELPASTDAPAPAPAAGTQPRAEWFLVAQIKENMTLTKPTLIVTDGKGVDFAITFEDRLNMKGFRKGYTLVVPQAAREEREEGKKAIVRVGEGRGGDVKVIPGSLEQVFELGLVAGVDGHGQKCAACGRTEGSLMKCTGCGTAAYCGKDCQARGWGELGHKSNCKVIKSIKGIWS